MDSVEPRFTAKYSSDDSKISWDLKKVAMVVGSVVLVLVLWIYVSSPMLVTVTGTGEVNAPAVSATVSFTLSASDPTAPQNAITSVGTKATAVRKFLLTNGVAEGDIAQSQVNAIPASLLAEGATGYQATISMAAKTTNVGTISTLVSDLYGQGALVVSQPILSVEDQNKLDKEAFKLALRDAKSQASRAGNANWKFIRKIVSISEVNSPSTSTSTTRADSSMETSDPEAAANGVFKLVKAVSVTYKMW